MKNFIQDILIALGIVIIATTIIKPATVSGTSMEPTLSEDNYLIANKLAYTIDDTPDYGDIIIFQSNLPNDNGSGNKILIKRVIGVEGDTIEIKGYDVYRNGKLLDEKYVNTLPDNEAPLEVTSTLKATIPEGKLFVMGDNRAVSLDSRSESVGLVDKSEIIGKALVKVFPLNELGSL